MHKSPTKYFKSPMKIQSPLIQQDSNKSERYIQSRSNLSITSFLDPKDLHSYFPSSFQYLPAPPPVPLKSYKILDAPNISQNPSFSLIDWSERNNISVLLSSHVYLYSVSTQKVSKIHSSLQDLTCTKFNQSGTLLALGSELGQTSIIDLEKIEVVQRINEHTGYITSCIWNKNVITTAGFDGYLVHRDLRSPSVLSKFKAHSREICGMDLNHDYLATCSTDMSIKVWHDYSKNSMKTLGNQDIIGKNVIWSRNEGNVLITTGDMKIRTWNVNDGSIIREKETENLIACVGASFQQNEIICGDEDGFSVWKYPELSLKGLGNEGGAVCICCGPEDEMLTTGSDETLRFWKIFDREKSKSEDFFGEFR